MTGALVGIQRAVVRVALVPVVLVGELLVIHPADQGEAFALLIAAFAAWAAAILAVHVTAHRTRRRAPVWLRRAEPFVDLAAIAGLTYTSGGPFSEVGMAFFVLPLLAAASLRPQATAGWAAAATAAFAALSLLHRTAGEPQATARMAAQLGYLVCAGLAATLLSAVLTRRTAAISALAQQRGELVAQALTAEQRERRRLADLLHDESVQILALAQQELGDYRRTGREASFERARAAIAEALGQLRGEIFELHPYLLEHAGLGAALAAVTERWAERTGAHLTVAIDPDAAGAHDELVVVLVRELLANVAKHSGAANVAVTLLAEPERIVLTVRDDGAGFEPDRHAEALRDGHIGLASCERRVHAAGGALRVTSAPGHGTTVDIELPRGAKREGPRRPRRRSPPAPSPRPASGGRSPRER